MLQQLDEAIYESVHRYFIVESSTGVRARAELQKARKKVPACGPKQFVNHFKPFLNQNEADAYIVSTKKKKRYEKRRKHFPTEILSVQVEVFHISQSRRMVSSWLWLRRSESNFRYIRDENPTLGIRFETSSQRKGSRQNSSRNALGITWSDLTLFEASCKNHREGKATNPRFLMRTIWWGADYYGKK